MRNFFLSSIITVFIGLLFTSCGYQPSSKFARDVVGERISTSIVISSEDPENTVVIKGAVDSAIVSVFHASLSSKAASDTHLVLSINTPSYSPIQYDENGFIVAYRMAIVLSIRKYHSGIMKTYSAKGTHDFSINPNAVVTDQERFEAIKLSATKAISSFISQVSAEGARAKKAGKK